MKRHILVTGASGLVGKQLISELLRQGHTVSALIRSNKPIPGVKTYLWDIYKDTIDPACITDADTIIHLAGESIAGKKWSTAYKQQVIDSRVKSTQLLQKLIRDTNAPVGSFISAAAVGYYGDCGDEILSETSANGYGFMAECCAQWEDAIDKGRRLGMRIVKFRLGVVLSKDGGALASFEKPIRFFTGAPLGSGKQWIPWVHIDDIVSMFIKALDNTAFNGVYNACAPFPVTNETLTKTIAKTLRRPVWPFHVPEKVIRMLLGEMSTIVLTSTNTSAQKLLDEGFRFKYTHLEDALAAIYTK
ncbi:TIGR01777 family oxidoreductase [Pedobacter sp. JY14-1]|uniref:TIGR01777 family oxidoreductase n=1 Tax=Pedobacter sp. JY14-1 TaxID=3034151 RepID=UPI0023E31EB4|nr:TIGR01777 family oxidoreductase [Pedobacter sp. JY14-1]